MNKKTGILKTMNIRNLISTGLFIGVFVALFLAINYKAQLSLNSFKVSINGVAGNKKLVSKKEVKLMVERQLGFELKKATIDDLDLMALESILDNDSRVKNAEVYLSSKRGLCIDITQKEPIYRINRSSKEPYYMDDMGSRISIKRSVQKVRVPIVTGKVDAYHPEFKNIRNNNLRDIHRFFRIILKDEFLRSLVSQLHVEERDHYIIIPQLGNKKIILGTMDDLDKKLEKLKIYYKKAGLDDFKELDLRYGDLVYGRT
jgi:cell division protein FtsQ